MATKSKTKPTANGVPTPPGDVLTLAEAAAFLRVPEAGLRQDAEAGRVPGRLVAGEWRFSHGGLFIWLGQSEPIKPAQTGAELVERLRRIREQSPYHETEQELEEFLAQIYAARKADVMAESR